MRLEALQANVSGPAAQCVSTCGCYLQIPLHSALPLQLPSRRKRTSRRVRPLQLLVWAEALLPVPAEAHPLDAALALVLVQGRSPGASRLAPQQLCMAALCSLLHASLRGHGSRAAARHLKRPTKLPQQHRLHQVRLRQRRS